jgi:hypothetical protein
MVNVIDKSDRDKVIGKYVRIPSMRIVGKIIDCVEEWDCAWNNYKTWLILDNGSRIYANKVGMIGETSVTLRCGL